MTKYRHYYSAEIHISPELVADLMITAFEGGSNYWLAGWSLRSAKTETRRGQPWYADPHLYEDDFTIDLTLSEEDGSLGEKRIVELENVQIGINKMATNSTGFFADMVNGNWDAETADVFLQYVALGEIIYG